MEGMMDGVHVLTDGTRVWWSRGKIHREDGPAIERNDGTLRWIQNGLLHREDGPAIVGTNGYTAWCLYGERLKVRTLKGLKKKLKELLIRKIMEA